MVVQLHWNQKVNLRSQFVPQGIGADLIATTGGYARKDVDSFALESHKRAAKATKKGYFKSIVPIYDQMVYIFYRKMKT